MKLLTKAAAVLLVSFSRMVAGGVCNTGSTDDYHRWSGTIAGPLSPGTYTELQTIGTGDTITISCLRMTESPQTVGCTSSSVVQLCRDVVSESTCQALSEYTFETHKDVKRGSSDGAEVAWIIAFDGLGKSSDCYARTVDVEMIAAVSGKDGGSSSLALSIIAVIVVSALVLCIIVMVLIYCHRQSTRKQEAQIPEHQMQAEPDEMEARKTVFEPNTTHGMYSVNPIQTTFDNKGLHGGVPGGTISPRPPATNEFSGPLHTLVYTTPRTSSPIMASPFSEPMSVACVDCGAQIGHPKTTIKCPVSGSLHPQKLLT
eukprot:TRINITY_DN14497_c0_g1_i1.p1 TRINITY_DN14497_c0_g1~~TRINITY_DN14497_c0_g1_i1.p1  ORF type:complete len:315 (+),score=36.12 TRINITY_DN14497_c0_g1_i1:50-994(+)